MLELAALLLGTVTTSLIALAVFMKNPRSLTSQLLVGVSVGLVGWSVTTYFSLRAATDMDTLFWIRAIMFFVVLQNTSFFLLVNAFPSNRFDILRRRRFWLAIAYSILTAGVALSPYLFTDFKESPIPGPGMALFLPHAIVFAGGGVLTIIYRTIKSKGVVRTQLRYLLAGTLAMFTLVPVSNFVLPVVFHWNQLVVFSPLYSVLFAGLVAYAIIRHRLFDLKRAVVRTIAYLLSLATILILFSVLFLFGITRILGFDTLALDKQLLLFGFAVVAGLFVPPLARLFDVGTRRLFFRKGYDSQQAIDEMTGVFVQADTLKELLENSSRLLMQILGASAVTVSLTHADGAGQRVAYTTLPSQAEHPEPVLTEAHMLATGTRLVALDELEDIEGTLGAELNAMNIGVVSQLHSPVGIVGYLMIGYKQNGTHYGRQDLDFIDIIGDEFAIAIQSELRFDEIKKFNIELQHKIDEATRELQASNKKLQELDRAKDEFISMASHQLRTPLTTVKGYLSMVLEGDVGKVVPAQKKVLEEAYDSAQRMVFLIGDFLNVSRLQTGRFIMEWASVDLSRIIAQEVSQLKPSAKSRKIELVYKAPASFPEIVVDENKLRQVMMNFIDNAIYYSKPDTTIDVSLVKLAGEVVFKVTDHGIGVPLSEQPQLFTKFYRASNAKKQRPDGTGIGLFMAKKVIVAHGGSVIFETKEGKGSTFGFRIPLKNDLQQLEDQPAKEE